MPDRDPSEVQIARAVALAREVLGASLLAVYLHGSAVEGGLVPAA